MTSSVQKLALLRAAMIRNGIDVYILPSSDPHLGEYIPDHWKIVPWLTGFTGSAATVVITNEFAGLFTDSRYFIQAQNELADSGIILVKPEPFKAPDYVDWLYKIIARSSRIGFDGKIISVAQYRRMENKLKDRDISYNTDCDLITDIWNERPPMPDSEASDHPVKYSGIDRSAKISRVREQMKQQLIDVHLLTSPDDIMWLLNIRGSDLAYSPLLSSFALISDSRLLFFTESKKVPNELSEEFSRLGIEMHPYNEITGFLSTLRENSSILITPVTTSVKLFNSIPGKLRITEDISIPCRLKAIRNKTEIENTGRVMIKDGVALTKFFYWFEQNLGREVMTELSLADKLLCFRSQQSDFIGPAFPAIIAFNEHSALPHYTPETGHDSEICENGILLVDSGGQYRGGTTDITRTIATGIPTAKQRTDFTLVLKGHINLACVKFPAGTRGYQLDAFARKDLWEKGMNYGHGTGHGVGYCLNVHEGPQNISPGDTKVAMEAGMLTSNEPAIYREGEYGIRIENLILCFEDEETEFGQFLKFDTVSLCYIDIKLIDKSLLDIVETTWLNRYHSEVYDKLSPHLSESEKRWLKEKTDFI